MGKFCRLFAVLVALWPIWAVAQGPTGGNPAFQYYYAGSGPVTNPANWLPVTSAGGGGGLSVTDGAAFTAGTSPFTPSGCQYNSTPPAISSGTQGTPACDAFRAFMVDIPLPAANANNLYNVLTAPGPCKAGTAPSTQTPVLTGVTTAVQCDLNGNTYVSPQQVGGILAVKGGAPVVNGGSFYEAVAASQTATVLQSSTGAAGDYLSHCDIYPTSTSPGVVTVFDSTNTAANSVILFPVVHPRFPISCHLRSLWVQ